MYQKCRLNLTYSIYKFTNTSKGKVKEYFMLVVEAAEKQESSRASCLGKQFDPEYLVSVRKWEELK